MYSDDLKITIVLESINILIEAATVMYKNADSCTFSKILNDSKSMLRIMQKITFQFSNYKFIKYYENLENIIFSLDNIYKLYQIKSHKLLDKIEFEYIPFLREFYFIFYYFSLVLGNKEKEKCFEDNEYDELTVNQYYKNVIDNNKNFKYDVSICVCAFNKLEATKLCIESIIKYTPSEINFEIILINNGSTDGTHEYFESLGVKKYINIKNNTMISGACGRIFEGKYTCNISNDVLVTKNYLKNLIKCMESDEKIIMVVPTTPNVSNMQTIHCSYNSMDEMYNFAERNNVSNSRKWEQRVRLCNPLTFMKAELCTKYNKKLMLADKYFVHYEFNDDAVCTRIRRLGLKMILAKDCFCHHFGSLTLGKKQREENTLMKSRKLFFDKFGVDAWSKGFCFDSSLIDSLTFISDKDINILGINSGLGSNPLKIQDCYKQKGLVAKVYNITDDKRYELDLKGVSDFVEVTNKVNFHKAFNDIKFNYIIFEDGIDDILIIEKLKLRLKENGGLYIYILDNSNIRMPKASKIVDAVVMPNGLSGKWYLYNN